MYLAHITENAEQTLEDHCRNTASYARSSLAGTLFENMAYCGGVSHDMGKAKAEFQSYLHNDSAKKGSVNHTFAAVKWFLENFHSGSNNANARLLSEILSFAVGSHHGMFDCCGLDCDSESSDNGFIHRLNYKNEDIGYEESKSVFFESVCSEDELKSLFDKSTNDFEKFLNECVIFIKQNKFSQRQLFVLISFLCRLILSSIIYGDRRDTIEFMKSKKHETFNIDWNEELVLLEKKLEIFTEGGLNDIRRNISDQCRNFAENPSGIYKLNVPTGAGKTLSSLRYAYAHAAKFNKKRIIFVIPLLSVLDQNSQVIRKYISNQDYIFEHHSNVLEDVLKRPQEDLDRYELLAASWDSPIIITTLVQLLDVFFAHKTSQIGRMQALVNSVVVIDEIQSLPIKTILMFNMAMNFFARFCNTAFVLSSATQPALNNVKWPVIYSVPENIVNLTDEQKNAFKCSEIINHTDSFGMSIDECADFCCERIAECDSLLLICNTKGEAQDIYKIVSEQFRDECYVKVFHLSTSMCKAHRQKTLTSIKEALKNVQQHKDEKVICISTQLVEAGIDFSFENVIRVIAGIDNLAQAAGRCNRNNEYENSGKVFLINLKIESKNLQKLPDIRNAQVSTSEVIHGLSDKTFKDDIIGEKAIELFYSRLYTHEAENLPYPVKIDGKNLFLSELLANENRFAEMNDLNLKYFIRIPFSTAAKNFQVFEDCTYDILVPYDGGKEKIEALRSKLADPHKMTEAYKDVQNLQQYSVNIYEWQKNKLIENGFLEAYPDRLNFRVLILSETAYNDETGVIFPENFNDDDFII